MLRPNSPTFNRTWRSPWAVWPGCLGISWHSSPLKTPWRRPWALHSPGKGNIRWEITRHPNPLIICVVEESPPWRWRCPVVSAAAGSYPPPPCCTAGWAQILFETSHRWPLQSGSFLCSAAPPPGYASSGRGNWNSLKRDIVTHGLKQLYIVCYMVFLFVVNKYLLVSMVRLLHCSSTSPCFFPDRVNGVSNTKRLMLWCLSKSVLLSCCSFSSKKGTTYVTWM